MLSRETAALFREQGFVVARGVLDPSSDLAPLREGYSRLLDRLAPDLLAHEPELLRSWPHSSFPDKVATLYGATGGWVYDHLDPLLALHRHDYRRRRELASPYLPELFALMRNDRVLDLVEAVLGPEITASPSFHVNLKLGRRHLERTRRSARGCARESPLDPDAVDFRVDRTPVHNDACFGLKTAWTSGTVIAWIPLTEATVETAALTVVPGSHKQDPPGTALGAELVAEAMPGDIILLDNRLDHGSTANRREESLRWAFNFRYVPTGAPTGYPFLPSFVARSRSDPSRELHDPGLWSGMWEHALDCVRWYDFPVSLGELNLAEAEEMTARWNARIPDHRAWLDLREPGLADRLVREPRARARRLRIWLGARRRALWPTG